MNEQCICIPDSDECTIRTDAYNKGIEDFIENLTLPIITEEQLDQIRKSVNLSMLTNPQAADLLKKNFRRFANLSGRKCFGHRAFVF